MMGKVIFSVISLLIGAFFLLLGIVGGNQINIVGQIISALVGMVMVVIALGNMTGTTSS